MDSVAEYVSEFVREDEEGWLARLLVVVEAWYARPVASKPFA
jgi:hypothetical protein